MSDSLLGHFFKQFYLLRESYADDTFVRIGISVFMNTQAAHLAMKDLN